MEQVILYIDSSSSRCGACGLSCDPHEKAHERPMGYARLEGCGAVYTHVVETYAPWGVTITSIRPDLISLR